MSNMTADPATLPQLTTSVIEQLEATAATHDWQHIEQMCRDERQRRA
jgi:hypothetical protein